MKSTLKIFAAVLSALLVAMAIAYSFISHLAWANRRDEIKASINAAYAAGNEAGGSPEQRLSSLNHASKVARESQLMFLEWMKKKTLPLNSDEKREIESVTKMLYADWGFRKKNYEDGMTVWGDSSPQEKQYHIESIQEYADAIEQNRPYSDADLPLVPSLRESAEKLKSK